MWQTITVVLKIINHKGVQKLQLKKKQKNVDNNKNFSRLHIFESGNADSDKRTEYTYIYIINKHNKYRNQTHICH